MDLRLKIPPVILVLLGLLLIRGLDWLWPQTRFIVTGASWLSYLLLVAAALLLLPSVQAFRRATTTVDPRKPQQARQLVTTGIYAYSRNPMYLGFLCLLLAAVLWTMNVTGLLVAAAFVIYMNRYQILPEEQALLGLFGDDYGAYCRRVRRWL